MDDLVERIQRLRGRFHGEVKKAADAGDTAEIAVANARLQRVDHLIAQVTEIKRVVSQLEDGRETEPNWAMSSTASPEGVKEASERESSLARGRRMARESRRKLLQLLEEQGIRAQQVGQTQFRLADGRLVGVSYANELKGIERRWFLGLPKEDYSAIILTCRARTGEETRFFLPAEFVRKHRGDFSESNGQLKLNVRKNGSGYVLSLSRVGYVPITEYINRLDGLR